MPLSKIEFQPGVIRDDTTLTAEGGFVDASGVRFRQGKAQSTGGFELLSTSTLDGPCRGLHIFNRLSGNPVVVAGTPSKAWAYSGGVLTDITPTYHSEGILENPFDTENGSAVVTVTHTEHGLLAGQKVTFSNATAVGGITVNGEYTIATIITRDKYTITHTSNATSTANGGARVDFHAEWLPGLTDGLRGYGYGSSSYGVGEYGVTGQADLRATVWSIDNFGEVALLCRRGGPLYLYQPADSYPELLTSDYALGADWTPGAGTFTKVAGSVSNLSQNIEGVVRAGYVYRVTFQATVSAGSVSLRINTVDGTIEVGNASIAVTKDGTYTALVVMPPDPLDIVWRSDATFAGTITPVSMKLEEKASFVTEAPRKIDVMWIDSARVVYAGGTYEVDGDYNPMVVRASDQENFRSWIPSSENLADEFPLAGGGRIVAALATRQQNLIWTDAALFSQQRGEDGTYSYQLRGTGCGAMGANAVAEQNGFVFWWGSNGNPYMFRGTVPEVIVCRLIREAFSNLAGAQEEKVFAYAGSEFNEFGLLYPDARDGDECSRILRFNWVEQHWVADEKARTAWAGEGILARPISVGPDGTLYVEEFGESANGNALSGRLKTAWFDIADGDKFTKIASFWPDLQDQHGVITLRVYARDSARGAVRTYGPFSVTPQTERVPCRVSGRQVAFEWTWNTAPFFMRLGVIEADIIQPGERR